MMLASSVLLIAGMKDSFKAKYKQSISISINLSRTIKGNIHKLVPSPISTHCLAIITLRETLGLQTALYKLEEAVFIPDDGGCLSMEAKRRNISVF